MELFLQLVLNGLVVGSIYALVALGFVIIYKATSILNFAQGEFLMLGAYVCLAIMTRFAVPFVWAFVLTLGFSVLLGLALERIVLRPLIGEPVISVIMVTLGLSSVLKAIVQGIWGTDTRPFPQVFSTTPVQLGPLPVSQGYLWSIACVTLLLALFTAFFRGTPAGAILLPSVRGGVDGSLAFFGLKVIPVVILGGLDSVAGAIVGGLVIGVLEDLSGGCLVRLFGGGVKEVAPFVALVLILMVKPYGLFGKVHIERV